MARRQKEIFAHENKYEGNIFKKLGKWFVDLEKWQKGLLIGIVVVLVLAIGIGSFVFSKLGLLNRVNLNERELSCVDVDGYVNILLLGVDTRDMSNIEGAGADAIMILSIKEETGDVKLMSVYRDTYVKMGDEEYYDKITNANRVGGPELMIKSLNQAMDMNISKFAVVNFKSVADLVDAVGGITVTVEDYEIEQLNKYTKQTAKNIGKEDYQLVEKAGEQTLEGVQAVSYGRIRKGVGDDYKRTERMRIVLTKVFEKVKTMSVSELNGLLDLMLPQVQTNLSNNDILALAARLIDFNISSGAGWPYNVTSGLIDGVSYVFADDLYTNTQELHEKMFGQEGYEPSETVQNMSNTIISHMSQQATETKHVETKQDDDFADDKKDANSDKNTGTNGTGDSKKDEDDDSTKNSKKDKSKDEGDTSDKSVTSEDTEEEGSTETETPTESEPTTEPETPVEPSTPTEPETPVEPDTPTESETPVEPDTPTESDTDSTETK